MISSQRELASICSISLGSVNAALKRLKGDSFSSRFNLTESGFRLLQDFRVDLLVIFDCLHGSLLDDCILGAPLSCVKINGLSLVERLIEQALEAGLSRVVLFAGANRALFFPFIEKYGSDTISIFDFDEIKEQLFAGDGLHQSAFFCDSTVYFEDNPFNSYVWDSYRLQAPDSSIANSRLDLPFFYFRKDIDSETSDLLKKTLVNTATCDSLYSLSLKPYLLSSSATSVTSFQDLLILDTNFADNLDSGVLRNISATLGCSYAQICNFKVLKNGSTNISFSFEVQSGQDSSKYVYRHPKVGVSSENDWNAEIQAQAIAESAGIDTTTLYEDMKYGWKISSFICSAQIDVNRIDGLDLLVSSIRSLHESNMSIDKKFDFYLEAKRCAAQLSQRVGMSLRVFDDLVSRIDSLQKFLELDSSPVFLSHNDVSPRNVLVDSEGEIHLIDWEYAGMSDYASDFGSLCVCSELNDRQVYHCLCRYLGHQPTLSELRHCYGMVAMAGWCWFLWSLLKEKEGVHVDRWLHVYYAFASTYSKRALSLYE